MDDSGVVEATADHPSAIDSMEESPMLNGKEYSGERRATVVTQKFQALLEEEMPVLVNPRPQAAATDSTDVIAFGSVENYCYEADPHVEIRLVRRGTGRGVITVNWSLENVNVIQESYFDQSGTVTFADGAMGSKLVVYLKDNDVWNLEVISSDRPWRMLRCPLPRHSNLSTFQILVAMHSWEN